MVLVMVTGDFPALGTCVRVPRILPSAEWIIGYFLHKHIILVCFKVRTMISVMLSTDTVELLF